MGNDAPKGFVKLFGAGQHAAAYLVKAATIVTIVENTEGHQTADLQGLERSTANETHKKEQASLFRQTRTKVEYCDGRQTTCIGVTNTWQEVVAAVDVALAQ